MRCGGRGRARARGGEVRAGRGRGRRDAIWRAGAHCPARGACASRAGCRPARSGTGRDEVSGRGRRASAGPGAGGGAGAGDPSIRSMRCVRRASSRAPRSARGPLTRPAAAHRTAPRAGARRCVREWNVQVLLESDANRSELHAWRQQPGGGDRLDQELRVRGREVARDSDLRRGLRRARRREPAQPLPTPLARGCWSARCLGCAQTAASPVTCRTTTLCELRRRRGAHGHQRRGRSRPRWERWSSRRACASCACSRARRAAGEGFVRDGLTMLPPTRERMLASSVRWVRRVAGVPMGVRVGCVGAGAFRWRLR